MKLKVALAAIVGCAALSLALPALAQYGPGQYWGEYNGPALVDGASVTVLYTGPYEGSYGPGAGLYGGAVNGNTAGIVCDDYYDEISGGESWAATAHQASNLASSWSSTLFGSAIGLNGYAELATLASYMLSNGAGPITVNGNSYTHVQISAAMWFITSTGIGKPITIDATVQTLVTFVQGLVGGQSSLSTYLAQFSDIFVLTPGGKTGDPNEPQEMWVQEVPEGGAALLYLLLAGIACFGAMRFSSRKEFGIRAA
jgi:hypothetical protein